MEWTDDLDRELLGAPIPIQAIIDKIETIEACPVSPALDKIFGGKYRIWLQNVSLAVPYLRIKKNKCEQLILRSRWEWLKLLIEFDEGLPQSDELTDVRRRRARVELKKALEIEKAEQFVIRMDPNDRKELFRRSSITFDAAQDQGEAYLRDQGISMDEIKKLWQQVTEQTEKEARAAGYCREPSPLTGDENELFSCDVGDYICRRLNRILWNKK